MKKIALTAAALLVATGAAFADSGSFQQPANTNHATASAATDVDNMPTGSINKLFTASGDHANTNTSVPSDPSQRFWGR